MDANSDEKTAHKDLEDVSLEPEQGNAISDVNGDMDEKDKSTAQVEVSGAPLPKGHQDVRRHAYDIDGAAPSQLNAVFENPLAGIPIEQLMADVEEFCDKFGLIDSVAVMKKGALIAQNPHAFRAIPELTNEEKMIIGREKSHKWDHPWQLYWLCGRYHHDILCKPC